MKLKLNAEGAEPIKVLAIMSYEPQYKVAWLLNQMFGWNLAESEVLNITSKEMNEIRQFVVFSWSNAENGSNYYLIQNKCACGLLEPTMRVVDYWLRIEGDADMSDISLNIKKIEGVQMTQEMKPDNFKKKSVVFRSPLYQSNL